MTKDIWETDIKNKSLDEKLDIIENMENLQYLTDEHFELLGLLSDDEIAEVKVRVAEILGISNSLIAERILIKLLSDKDELVRANACDSLGASNSMEVLNLLKNKTIKDKSTLVRGYCILSIENIAYNMRYNKKELREFWGNALMKEKIHWVKIHLYKALYNLGDESMNHI